MFMDEIHIELSVINIKESSIYSMLNFLMSAKVIGTRFDVSKFEQAFYPYFKTTFSNNPPLIKFFTLPLPIVDKV